MKASSPIEITYQDYTLLIVDDNPTNLAVISNYLRQFGFQIIVAREGESALKRAEHVRPNLILLDVMMPGLDGFEVCRRLKADETTQDIPVIFMTALDSADDKVKGFTVGAVDYVTKPVQQEEVLVRVTTHLLIRDQAKRLQAQTVQLQTKTEQLIALNASKDKFFSIVAHDLKGPFLPLLGNLEFLIKRAPTSSPLEIREMCSASYLAAERIFELLENLLQWSQMQTGGMECDPEQVDLSLMADNDVDLLADMARRKGITLRNQVPVGASVYADKSMIDTVIRNLVNNALKFTSAGGHVAILAHPNGRFMEISIEDTGVGIKKEDMAKLFSLNAPHSTVGTGQEKGTGLGLIMCKEMVEQNGGQIWIESEPGLGTQVKITVPLRKN